MIVRWVAVVVAVLMLTAGAFAAGTAGARLDSRMAGTVAKAETKKKKLPARKPDPPKKESYQLPMKVVVVRSSETGCEPNCPEWIQAEGEIKPGSAAEFRKVFKQVGKRNLPVVIRSPGGSMEAALEIGRMIRKRGLDVAVGYTIYKGCAPHDKTCKLPKEQKGVYRGQPSEFYAFCTSACPLILAAGTDRIAGRNTYVGVHQVRTTWVQQRIYYREKYRIVNGKKKVLERKEVKRKTVKSFEKAGMDKRLRKTLTAYLKDMGIDLGILEDMEWASPQDMYRLPESRLKQLNLVTSAGAVGTLLIAQRCRGSENCTGQSVEAKAEATELASAGPEVSERPALTEKEALLRVGISQSAAPMTVVRVRLSDGRCEPHCPEWIQAWGAIGRDSPGLIEAALKSSADVTLPLLINSPGGDFDAALEIAEKIKQRHVDVYVASTNFFECSPRDDACRSKSLFRGRPDPRSACDGACLLVLASGRLRWIGGYSEEPKLFGPEAFYSNDVKTGAPSRLQAFLLAEGLPELWERMRKLKGFSAEKLHLSELEDVKLINTSWRLSQLIDASSCLSYYPNNNCVKR